MSVLCSTTPLLASNTRSACSKHTKLCVQSKQSVSTRQLIAHTHTTSQNPVTLKPFDERAAAEAELHARQRDEFMASLSELDEILAAREEALTRQLSQIERINVELEKMPTDLAIAV